MIIRRIGEFECGDGSEFSLSLCRDSGCIYGELKRVREYVHIGINLVSPPWGSPNSWCIAHGMHLLMWHVILMS